jgi:hypothetical protein
MGAPFGKRNRHLLPLLVFPSPAQIGGRDSQSFVNEIMENLGYCLGEIFRSDLLPLAGTVTAAFQFLEEEVTRVSLLLNRFVIRHDSITCAGISDPGFSQSREHHPRIGLVGETKVSRFGKLHGERIDPITLDFQVAESSRSR